MVTNVIKILFKEIISYQIKEDERTAHVACMGEIKNRYKSLVVRTEGKKHSEDLGVDGR
jgi:hypothetical protein